MGWDLEIASQTSNCNTFPWDKQCPNSSGHLIILKQIWELVYRLIQILKNARTFTRDSRHLWNPRTSCLGLILNFIFFFLTTVISAWPRQFFLFLLFYSFFFFLPSHLDESGSINYSLGVYQKGKESLGVTLTHLRPVK